MATKFNANTVLLSVWPWTVYFFVRSIETRTMPPAIMFGVLCAAAMLAKYVSVMLLGACLAAALLHPSRVQYFRSPAPYVSMAVAAVLLTPHIAWSISHDFPTIKYALGKADGDLLFKQWKGFKAAGVTSLLLSPMLFGIRLALGRTGWESISWTRFCRMSRAPGFTCWLSDRCCLRGCWACSAL